MSVLAFFAVLAFQLSAARRLNPIGPGFWNIRGVFEVGPIDVGTQMSIIQLDSGKFVVVDTVDLKEDLQVEFNVLTQNGTLVEAIIATHPFHTTYFPAWYQAYPNIPFYGTPRHLRIQPQIPWAGSMYDCANRQQWLPQIHMRIPAGAEFVSPQPESSNHFTSILVFHPASRTIHVDDTIDLDEPFVGDMLFHPSLVGPALYHVSGTPFAFRDWVQKIINEWNFDNIVAAHKGIKISGAKAQLQSLLSSSGTSLILNELNVRFSLFPVAEDAAKWDEMKKHEAACVE